MSRKSEPKVTTGSRIREAREALGAEVEALAKAVSSRKNNVADVQMDAARLRAIEEGAEPTADELERLAYKLGRGVTELARGPLRDFLPHERAAARFAISRSQGGRAPTTGDPVLRANIAANLRSYRDAVGLSQREAGQILGIAQNNIAHHEDAAAKTGPTEESLAKYAQAYRCTVEDLKAPPRPVYRGKLAGDMSLLSTEQREALMRKIEAVEASISDELVSAVEAARRRMARRR